MSKLKVKLNRQGVRNLLKSDEMMDICLKHANKAKSHLGDGYEISTHIGKNRVNVSVAAVTYKAKKENSEGNTILKALGGQK